MKRSFPASLLQIHEQTRITYDLAAQRYHELFHNEMADKPFDRDFLTHFCKTLPPSATILDAGCGPCGHIGRFVFDLGYRVMGVDISEKCIHLAQQHNPDIPYYCQDLLDLKFPEETFDAVIAFYSIIDTPKRWIPLFFTEFFRILKPRGKLLVVVKAGNREGYLTTLLGISSDIYYCEFSQAEIENFIKESGFHLDHIEVRDPYAFEINSSRIYATCVKPLN